MLNQKDNVIRERGGVPFKDYTKGGSLVKDRTFEEKTGSGMNCTL